MMPRRKIRPEKRRRRVRITPEILGRILDLRRRGLTYLAIATKIKISCQTVAKYVRKEGLGGRKRKVTREVLERMDNLLRKGMPKKRIARKLNLSYGTVLRYLKEKAGAVEKLKKWLDLK